MKLMQVHGSGLALIFLVSACGMFNKKEKNNLPDELEFRNDNRGCVQGVLTDGISGERVAFPKDRGNEQVGAFVQVRNNLVEATPKVSDPDAKNVNENLVGDYHVCDIPLDEAFPLYVWIPGYQPFESRIFIPSTISQRTPNSEQEDRLRTHPTFIANVSLAPESAEAVALLFDVKVGDKEMMGAQVYVRPSGLSEDLSWEDGNNGVERTGISGADAWFSVFGAGTRPLPQMNYRQIPLHGETDQGGTVTFTEGLVPGGLYSYKVFAMDSGEQQLVQQGTVQIGFTAGGGSARLVNGAHRVQINFPAVAPERTDDGTVSRP